MNYKHVLCVLAASILAGCAFLRSSYDLSAMRPLASQQLFDGESFGGWAPFVKSQYDTGGPVELKGGAITLSAGRPYSAVLWSGGFPRTNYEIELSAMKTDGNDIFCGLLFPVGTNYCSMILGGWGNSIVGLSCVDYMTAADNSTATMKAFNADEWYDVRLKVTDEKIEAWVNEEQLIDLELFEKRISPYFGLEIFAPFGIFTFETAGMVKDIFIRRLEEMESQ